MIPTIPWYATAAVLATNLALAIGLWHLLAAGADRAGLRPDAARRVRTGTAIAIAAWLGLALLAAPAPASLLGRDRFYLTPLLPLFGIGSVALVLLARRLSPSFRLALAGAPLAEMHGLQLFRIIGALFLLLLVQGALPAHFASPAGWGDVAVGLSAPVVALALAARRPGAVGLAAAWNTLGLLDLVVAVGMGTGFLAPILAPELGARVPPVAPMGVFPLVVVPLFAVPVAVMLHVAGLARLLRARRADSGLVPRHAS
jgi:hypothetical protein